MNRNVAAFVMSLAFDGCFRQCRLSVTKRSSNCLGLVDPSGRFVAIPSLLALSCKFMPVASSYQFTIQRSVTQLSKDKGSGQAQQGRKINLDLVEFQSSCDCKDQSSKTAEWRDFSTFSVTMLQSHGSNFAHFPAGRSSRRRSCDVL